MNTRIRIPYGSPSYTAKKNSIQYIEFFSLLLL